MCSELGIKLSQELNMTYDAEEFFVPVNDVLPGGDDPRDPDVAQVLLATGYLPLHEGKTFHQYTDHWDDRPRYLVSLHKLARRPDILRAAGYYRLAFRAVASSTNERTILITCLPPCVLGNSAPGERDPGQRANSLALLLVALSNSFVADWTLRVKSAANVNLFLLNAARLFPASDTRLFFIHAALRLTAIHAGFAPLWIEQLGSSWCESIPLYEWPVLASDHD